MNIHYLQHVPFEGLGSIESWATNRGCIITCSKLYLGNEFPPVDSFDFLVIMGGPMGVNDEIKYPWLIQEKRFIQTAINAGKTILGICLGAQLLAKVLGADVYSNSHKEIGWFPVEKTDMAATKNIGSVIADVVTAFHWHGETFDIPAGAVHLTRSKACENQAFIYEDRLIGLQYHLETTKAAATALIKNCSSEIIETNYIQSEKEMLYDQSKFDRINCEMERLLDYIKLSFCKQAV